MSKATLLLGGNMGDRVAILDSAKTHIAQKAGEILKYSSLYESESWGFNSENTFLNQVIQIETSLAPHQLLDELKSIEIKHGRRKNNSEEYSSRLLDVDILFYNDDSFEDHDLVIPHPRLHKRKFTLLPLREIDCNYVHPKLNKTIEEIYHDCDDQLEVKLFDITTS